MWALYGYQYCVCGPYNYDTHCNTCCSNEKIIAIFDTKQAAKKYEKAARLKNPQRHRNYKRKSLLALCEYADVVEYYPDEAPLNPEINF